MDANMATTATVATTSTSLTAPQSFPLFSFLPAELRIQIWQESCSPRVVEVRYSQQLGRCLTTTKPPAILQATRESRHEGLRLYVRAFRTTQQQQQQEAIESYSLSPSRRPERQEESDESPSLPSIFFHPELDILYLPRCGNMGYDDTARDFSQYVVDTVQHVHAVAIDHVKPEIRRPWETYNKYCLLRNFPKLRETFLVISTPSSSASSSVVLGTASAAAADGGGGGGVEDEAGSSYAGVVGAEEEEIGFGQIEFVDPRGDRQAIMKVVENVMESFAYEVGLESLEMMLRKWDGDDDDDDNNEVDGNDGAGRGGKRGGEELEESPRRRRRRRLELIPKCKSTRHGWGGSPQRPGFVACV